MDSVFYLGQKAYYLEALDAVEGGFESEREDSPISQARLSYIEAHELSKMYLHPLNIVRLQLAIDFSAFLRRVYRNCGASTSVLLESRRKPIMSPKTADEEEANLLLRRIERNIHDLFTNCQRD